MMGFLVDVLETVAQRLLADGMSKEAVEQMLSKQVSPEVIRSIVEKIASEIHF